MDRSAINIRGIEFPVYSCNTVIIGSGAAALSAALNLIKLGQPDIAILTENWGGGTSNNAGSDKQTYYKLSLAGDVLDSPHQMARDLFNGKCMHGDIALCEAQHSAQAFYRLVEAGVPFPHDKYGGYVGFRTDNDTRGRGTSAGPFTSKYMFEALAEQVKQLGIPIFNRHPVIELLKSDDGDERKIIGAVAIDEVNTHNRNYGFTLFNTVNIILATGAPAGIYRDSVFPVSQTGASGMALKIGAISQNLTEWQFGIASLQPRWNLSGSYQQVIPRYISTDDVGGDEREFLNDNFSDLQTLIEAVFLKGYEWPFDVYKIENYGSSLIDVLVYIERVRKNRRVFLDYTRNPSWNDKSASFELSNLSPVVRKYLSKSGALCEIPVERLRKMNEPAYNFFKQHGVDLKSGHLEIGVCVQHNNGGLRGNIWWESNVKHLFPVGEVNGSHGVYRPGGAALNSGQVGALRAALFIAKRYSDSPYSIDDFAERAKTDIAKCYNFAVDSLSRKNNNIVEKSLNEIRERMSHNAAIIRCEKSVDKAVGDAWKLYESLRDTISIAEAGSLPKAFKTMDLCLTHAVYLEAMQEYLRKGGKSRGSYIAAEDIIGMESICDYKGNGIDLNPENSYVDNNILEIGLNENLEIISEWVNIRPIPDDDSWFEEVWRQFRNDNIVN